MNRALAAVVVVGARPPGGAAQPAAPRGRWEYRVLTPKEIEGLGESRHSDPRRVAFGPGVSALYEVDPARRLVRAWSFRHRG
jgi:hypothetical protein